MDELPLEVVQIEPVARRSAAGRARPRCWAGTERCSGAISASPARIRAQRQRALQLAPRTQGALRANTDFFALSVRSSSATRMDLCEAFG
jgi:hypothetical protein